MINERWNESEGKQRQFKYYHKNIRRKYLSQFMKIYSLTYKYF